VSTQQIRVFKYIEPLDAFVFTEEYRRLADYLGLTEWHAGVWIGRLFMLDADYGEHWFDNWDAREALTEQAAGLGVEADDLMIVVPERLASGRDGPCHSSEFRKRFWTDVLKSLELSYDLLFEEARRMSARAKELASEVPQIEPIQDLERRIQTVQASLDSEGAWDAELERRMDEIRSGKATGVPADRVFAELREEYP
jgi:putative addiction module component (TIGR02574 family)